MYCAKILLLWVFTIAIVVIKLSPADFYQELQKAGNPVLLDVRVEEEFCKSRIANAQWAGKKDVLEALLANIDTNTPIFIYCEKGVRSKEVITLLSKMKYKKVYELEGGFANWVKQEFPVHKEVLKPISLKSGF